MGYGGPLFDGLLARRGAPIRGSLKFERKPADAPERLPGRLREGPTTDQQPVTDRDLLRDTLFGILESC